MKSGNLNFLEPSGPLQARNGTAGTYGKWLAVFFSTSLLAHQEGFRVGNAAFNNLKVPWYIGGKQTWVFPHYCSVETEKVKFGITNMCVNPWEVSSYILYQGTTFKNSTFCPHSVFVCFIRTCEQTAIISLYSINWLVFITETECVYCAVQTGSLCIILLSVHTVYLCVLCGSENKQRLFPYTALTDWFL